MNIKGAVVLEDRDIKSQIVEYIQNLPFGEGNTFDEIAQKFGISKNYVNGIARNLECVVMVRIGDKVHRCIINPKYKGEYLGSKAK